MHAFAPHVLEHFMRRCCVGMYAKAYAAMRVLKRGA